MRASDKAYSKLFHEIVDGDIAPGTVLAEVEQSTRLGVSRTPLREALSRLIADGLVESAPGRGVVVTEISLENITEHDLQLSDAIPRFSSELQNSLQMQTASLNRVKKVFATTTNSMKNLMKPLMRQ